VPVIGIGEAAFREAAVGGRRFSIATTTPLLEMSIRANVALLGFADQLASVRNSHQDPVALMRDPAALQAALSRLVERCIDDAEADAIIIGGGPLAAAARALSGATSVPIIEPVPAAVRWMCRKLNA
jgi:allantoin racemase